VLLDLTGSFVRRRCRYGGGNGVEAFGGSSAASRVEVTGAKPRLTVDGLALESPCALPPLPRALPASSAAGTARAAPAGAAGAVDAAAAEAAAEASADARVAGPALGDSILGLPPDGLGPSCGGGGGRGGRRSGGAATATTAGGGGTGGGTGGAVTKRRPRRLHPGASKDVAAADDAMAALSAALGIATMNPRQRVARRREEETVAAAAAAAVGPTTARKAGETAPAATAFAGSSVASSATAAWSTTSTAPSGAAVAAVETGGNEDKVKVARFDDAAGYCEGPPNFVDCLVAAAMLRRASDDAEAAAEAAEAAAPAGSAELTAAPSARRSALPPSAAAALTAVGPAASVTSTASKDLAIYTAPFVSGVLAGDEGYEGAPPLAITGAAAAGCGGHFLLLGGNDALDDGWDYGEGAAGARHHAAAKTASSRLAVLDCAANVWLALEAVTVPPDRHVRRPIEKALAKAEALVGEFYDDDDGEEAAAARAEAGRLKYELEGLPQPRPVALRRAGHACCFLGARLFVFGGTAGCALARHLEPRPEAEVAALGAAKDLLVCLAPAGVVAAEQGRRRRKGRGGKGPGEVEAEEEGGVAEAGSSSEEESLSDLWANRAPRDYEPDPNAVRVRMSDGNLVGVVARDIKAFVAAVGPENCFE